jgi:hypothetical protein
VTRKLIFDSFNILTEKTLRNIVFIDLIPVISKNYANIVFYYLSRILNKDKSRRTRDRVFKDTSRNLEYSIIA